MTLAELYAAKAAADAALAGAEADLLAELAEAKAACRCNPADDLARRRKAAAVADVQAYRATVRADRTGTTVAGDAYITGQG